MPRIFRRIRPGFRYSRSVQVLTQARTAGLLTKSNLILGLGEEPAEVRATLIDLYQAGCEIITITQYLRPSTRHYPVQRWVRPEEFSQYADDAQQIGFSAVMAGPLVRSSYRAGRLYAEALIRRSGISPARTAHTTAEGSAIHKQRACHSDDHLETTHSADT